MTIGTAFFLAESGDKTMLATVTLATTEGPVGTWLGSTAGMVAADAIAIAIGAFLGTRLPERAIALFAAGAFVLFGVFLIAEGFGLVQGPHALLAGLSARRDVQSLLAIAIGRLTLTLVLGAR